MNKKRLVWVDSLKGWLMLLVVMGHAIQYCMNDGECDFNYFWNLIYSFHMPAFMALSGFVNYRANTPPRYDSYITLCKRRTRQLLVPFFLWSVIKWLIDGSFCLVELVHITFSSGGFFWFLWALWVISIIFILGNMLSKFLDIKQQITDVAIMLALIMVMVLGDVRIFGFQYISYYFVFYIIGYYCNKYNKLFITNNIWHLVLGSLVWLLMASFWNMHHLPFFLQCIPYVPETILLYAYRFVTAFIGIYVVLNIGHRFLNTSVAFNARIAHIGQISLGLYVVHLVLIISLSKWLAIVLSPYPLPIIIVISFTLTSCIAISIVEILLRSDITAKLLLGKV